MAISAPSSAALEQEAGSGTVKWAAGLAMVLILALTLVSLQLFQLTVESVSLPAHSRALNALVEGDAIIVRNYDDLRARAESAQPDDTLELRDYPVSVPLTPEEVLASTPESLRLLLLERAVERMYADGTAVFRDDGASAPGRFTTAGIVDAWLDFLTDGNHGTLAIVTLVLAGVSVAAGVALVLLCRGFGRVVAIGAVTVLASLPVLVGGIAMRAYAEASSASDSEFLRGELSDVVVSLSWLPVRNGAALCALGLVVLIIGAACARWSGTREASL